MKNALKCFNLCFPKEDNPEHSKAFVENIVIFLWSKDGFPIVCCVLDLLLLYYF
jgi:hypothetical protein